MATKDIFAKQEIQFLKALVQYEVYFMVVGLSAAALQGAPVVTQDVDLWVKDLDCPIFHKALKSVGAIYVPSFGVNPPSIAGKGFGLFDLVLHMSGLNSFDEEFSKVEMINIGSFNIPVLSLERIIRSKKEAGRDKDKLVLAVLEDVLKTSKVIK